MTDLFKSLKKFSEFTTLQILVCVAESQGYWFLLWSLWMLVLGWGVRPQKRGGRGRELRS